MCLVSSRYSKILMSSKDLIKKILETNNFEEILDLEVEFKSKIVLPIYELFINDLKRSKINVI
jgi:hypothetical protein